MKDRYFVDEDGRNYVILSFGNLLKADEKDQVPENIEVHFAGFQKERPRRELSGLSCKRLRIRGLFSPPVAGAKDRSAFYEAISKSATLEYVNVFGPCTNDAALHAFLQALATATHVREVVLSRCQLHRRHAESVTKLLECPNLSTLILNNRNFLESSGLETFVKHFQASPPSFSSLRVLGLQGCGIASKSADVPELPHLLSSLSGATSLQVLDLRRNQMNDSDVSQVLFLPSKVAFPPKLHELALDVNDIADSGCEVLRDLLQREDCHLRNLSLFNNSVGSLGAVYLAEGLAASSSLERLSLRQNCVCGAGSWRLFGAVANRSDNFYLDLTANHISGFDMKTIAETFREAKSCPQSLHLNRNDIGCSGIRALSRSLCELAPVESLHTLALAVCEITADCAPDIAAVITACPNLETLILGSNRLGPPGARAIASAVGASSIRTLNLYYNRIGNAGTIEILERVLDKQSTPQNAKLQKLTLFDNDLRDTPNLRETVRKFIACVSSLRELSLGGNRHLTDKILEFCATGAFRSNSVELIYVNPLSTARELETADPNETYSSRDEPSSSASAGMALDHTIDAQIAASLQESIDLSNSLTEQHDRFSQRPLEERVALLRRDALPFNATRYEQFRGIMELYCEANRLGAQAVKPYLDRVETSNKTLADIIEEARRIRFAMRALRHVASSTKLPELPNEITDLIFTFAFPVVSPWQS